MAKSWSEFKQRLKGIVPVQICPYTREGEVDIEGFKENTKFLLDFAKKGKDVVILTNGSTTEFYANSIAEQKSIIKTVVGTVSGQIPVIAGGGIADARGLVAALALGAEGVLMGTRFMASQECPLHPKIKELMLQAGETDTIILERSARNAARVLKTDFSQKVLEMEEKGAPQEEIFPLIDGNRTKKSYSSGDTNDSIIYCGQVVGLIDEILSVKEIIDGIISEARLIMTL
mgnify:CR=1 FL=1